MVAHDMYPNVLNMSTKHDSPTGSLLKLFTLKTNGWNPKIKNVLKIRQQACVSYGSGCDMFKFSHDVMYKHGRFAVVGLKIATLVGFGR